MRSHVFHLLAEYGLNTFRFEIALGHRARIKGQWERMVKGNVTRTLTCRPNEKVGVSLKFVLEKWVVYL